MSTADSFADWGYEDSLQGFLDEQRAGAGQGSGGLIDRLLADLGSDPEHWFARHQQLTEAVRGKREAIATMRRRLAEYAALYESHGQQPSMFDNFRKIRLAEQVERIRAETEGKPPAEAALDSAARKSQPYQDFVNHHHQQKRRWLEEREDEAKLWAEMRALESEQQAAMERIQLLKSLIYYAGQEARTIPA